MHEATVVFTRSGLFNTTITAKDVHSHEHARKLWPLVTPTTPRQLVSWVRPIFDTVGNLVRRSHFRTLPGSRAISIDRFFDAEESVRYRAAKESKEHEQAKRLIAEALTKRLEQGLAMPWYFKDTDSSDFHLAGNLLLGADTVVTEKPVKTSFGCQYRLDVGIVSKVITKGPILLGGIEIEWGHPFDGRKALIGTSQAFPLISIDISDLSLADITPEWADLALTATTRNSEDNHRKTYVYLHDVLYPLYVQIPVGLLRENRHQYVVFASDSDLDKLQQAIGILKASLQLPSAAVIVAGVNAKSEQAQKMLDNLGAVVGPDWKAINAQRCLKITLDRPSTFDEAGHLFHIGLAYLLLSYTDSLVGYKYTTYLINEDPAEDLWRHGKWNPATKDFEYHRVLPKRLAEPRSRIVNVLNALGNDVV